MKTGKYRYVVAGLLFTAGAINYMDRAALGIVAPIVSKTLDLSPSQLGIIFSSFFIGYSIFSFLGGYFADKWGTVRVFTYAMGLWSLFCGLTAAATGFVSLLLCRVFFGIGEGPMSSNTNRTISNWFPRHETSTMIGFTFSGQTLGNAIAGPIVGLIAYAFDWRMSFIVIAVLGFLWLLVWRIFVTDKPANNARVHADERRLIDESRAVAEAANVEDDGMTLGAYLRRPSTLALGAGLFAVNYTQYVFISWLPSYLTNVLHLDLKQMSIITSIPWICGAIGYFGGGLIGDWIYRRMDDPVKARKLVATIPLALSGVAVLSITSATSLAAAVGLIAAALLFLTGSCQAIWAIQHEILPLHRQGGVGGFIHFLSNLSGIIGPALTGFLIQYFGGYHSAFLFGALIDFTGVIAMVLFVHNRRVSNLGIAGQSAR
ncbi:MFS transporter [Burkholderia sp. SFA1]|uniref:MFS transporter n=1 Tax=Caballeronia sp. CLC5 TaxID=2906764 RepID=UPI001F1E1D09|nr:MFS transporter [Caballeronia sp. CLC5]MCE4573611.1 MFS transporter [Caballeronia sp. CLC5]BBQ00456.1 MFS transporter [Burkholderia sp. SFA1]